MTPVALRRVRPGRRGRRRRGLAAVRHAAVPLVPAPVHTDEEVRHHFEVVVVPTRETWLAVGDGAVVAVMVPGRLPPSSQLTHQPYPGSKPAELIG